MRKSHGDPEVHTITGALGSVDAPESRSGQPELIPDQLEFSATDDATPDRRLRAVVVLAWSPIAGHT